MAGTSETEVTTGESIVKVFDFAWERFTGRLDDLTDEEYFWQPVPGGWTIRPDSTGRWVLEGAELGPYPDLDPTPITTIAWRISHLAWACVGQFTEKRFGSDGLVDELPRHAREVPDFLAANYGAWRRHLVALDDAEWHAPLGPDWGPYAQDSTLDLTLHVLDEVVHHGAEVGLLRDLYGRLPS